MTTREQALRELGLVVAEFSTEFMTQTLEEAARRAWRADGPSLDTLTQRCAMLRAKLGRGAAPAER
ncbi:hypothetical protein KV395_04250 [Microbacterium luteolum]|uniref:Uncharacterized protein n=1 Tax=Microbacterium luteolum TaxID=69367 RepID=A0ABY7XNA1_MICLT|nr:hypothetical protein [Microbacterium luteolum]WDM42529.1 hypothetical protein KV395_04250 [Microbacterium luteolum]